MLHFLLLYICSCIRCRKYLQSDDVTGFYPLSLPSRPALLSPRGSTGTAGETLPHRDRATGSKDQGLSERVLLWSVMWQTQQMWCVSRSLQYETMIALIFTCKPVEWNILILVVFFLLHASSYHPCRLSPVFISFFQEVYLLWCTSIQSLPSLCHVPFASQKKVILV